MYDDVVENPYEDTGGKDTVALTGVENVYFPSMRDWIKDHVEDAAQNKVVASETEKNALLADVIEVLNLLVKYGYYDDPEDVEAVLRPLLDVLNGFTDTPFSLSKSAESKWSDFVEAVAQVEMPCCACPGLTHVQFDDFTKKRRFMETVENKPIFDIKARCVYTCMYS